MNEEGTGVSLIYSVAAALQDIVIAPERLGSAIPAYDRTRRIRLSRDELLHWCDKVAQPREAEMATYAAGRMPSHFRRCSCLPFWHRSEPLKQLHE